MAAEESVTTESMYDYSSEYSDDICNKTLVITFGAILTPVFFIVVIVLSVLGNGLVLVVLLKYENLKSLTNTFLLNLAVSDLLFTIGLPFWAAYHVFGWIFGSGACQAVSFVFSVGFYSSILFLAIMTVHRYVAVVHPLAVVVPHRAGLAGLASGAIWAVSLLAALPQLLFSRVAVEPNDSVLHCGVEDRTWALHTIYQQNAIFVLAFLIISCCYARILCRLLRPRGHSRRRTLRLILCIVVVFFLSWAPYNVAIFLQTLATWQVTDFTDCDISTAVDYGFYVCRLMAFSHCCLNPVFYVFVGIKFRNHLKRMLWNFCRPNLEPPRRNSQLIYSNGEEFSMY